MAISSVRTTRPRLCVLYEAAGAAFLGRHTTSSSSSAWAPKKKVLSALYSPFRSPLSISRPYTHKLGLHCSPIVPTSPSSPLHGSLLFFDRKSYSTSHRQVLRKASTKSGFTSRVSGDKRSLGPGKVRKQGNNVRRSVTALASSRQKMATSVEERENRWPSTTLHMNKGKPMVQTYSRDSNYVDNLQRHNHKRALIAKPIAFSLSKNGVGLKKVTRSREDSSANSKESAQNMRSAKKGKRVMRLDPEDKTSKRLFEGYPLPGQEVQSEAPGATTGRAQFRLIVPSPKLMQHIEKHMLGRRRPSELQKAGYDMQITPAPLDNIPYSKKGERQPIQEEVFRHKLRFAAAAKTESSFPPVDIPEVAFAGRSNVGKSSLINALTRQWGVARTSDKPGLTQSINFFRLGGRLCLVDLPGYGFAYAAEEKKEAWEELVKEFVTTRAGLKRVYVLVDAKWGLKLKDEELIELMEKAGTKYQLVLTKSDMVTPVDLARRATQVHEVFKNNKHLVLPMLMVSAKTGEGLEFFRANVAKLAKASLI